MGYIIDKRAKKQQQVFLIYKPWAKIIQWIFQRFKELGSLPKLCREIEAMPFLFADPSTDDFLKYIFKIRMTRVPGGFKPTRYETIKDILTNPTYIGHWTYDNAIVRYDNHAPIIDKDLYLTVNFCIKTKLIDDIFLSRVKALALADPHIAQHIETSITELEEKHVEDAISLEDQLIQIRLQIKKKLAMLEDEILTLDVESKKKV
jgi:hypothetical protein